MVEIPKGITDYYFDNLHKFTNYSDFYKHFNREHDMSQYPESLLRVFYAMGYLDGVNEVYAKSEDGDNDE